MASAAPARSAMRVISAWRSGTCLATAARVADEASSMTACGLLEATPDGLCSRDDATAGVMVGALGDVIPR